MCELLSSRVDIEDSVLAIVRLQMILTHQQRLVC
jgi:hypothetical protein